MKDFREEDYLTVDEVAKKMRVNPYTVYRMAQKGKLPAIKFGRSWRFNAKQLAKFLDDKAKH